MCGGLKGPHTSARSHRAVTVCVRRKPARTGVRATTEGSSEVKGRDAPRAGRKGRGDEGDTRQHVGVLFESGRSLMRHFSPCILAAGKRDRRAWPSLSSASSSAAPFILAAALMTRRSRRPEPTTAFSGCRAQFPKSLFSCSFYFPFFLYILNFPLRVDGSLACIPRFTGPGHIKESPNWHQRPNRLHRPSLCPRLRYPPGDHLSGLPMPKQPGVRTEGTTSQ